MMAAMLITIVGCGGNEMTNSELDNSYTTTEISLEELELIKSLSIDDVEKYIIKSINIALEEFEELALEKIVLNEDELLLKKDSHEKALNNVFAETHLNFKEELEENKRKEVVDLFFNKLLETLSRENIESKRLNKINITFSTGLPSDNIYNGIGFKEMNEQINNLVFEQEGNLDILDENIYEILKPNLVSLDKNIEFDITRLGIEENVLKIETKIYVYTGEEYEANLEEINAKTLDTILENETMIKILKDNNINNMEFIYKGKWYEYGNPLVYEYELFN